jgi:peptide-methionine (S)-S-oxide reductase
MENDIETAVFGGGCFWCTEAIFTRLKGVRSVESGYTGGTTENPTYQQVSEGNTGHAEAIKIEFDPTEIQYKDLLNVFFATHDPTTLNRQGNDIGTQYRSAVFYTTNQQRDEAVEFIRVLEELGIYKGIVTEVVPLDKFYRAESYHERYYDRNPSQPYCQLVIDPKVAKLRTKFTQLLKGV